MLVTKIPTKPKNAARVALERAAAAVGALLSISTSAWFLFIALLSTYGLAAYLGFIHSDAQYFIEPLGVLFIIWSMTAGFVMFCAMICLTWWCAKRCVLPKMHEESE